MLVCAAAAYIRPHAETENTFKLSNSLLGGVSRVMAPIMRRQRHGPETNEHQVIRL